MVLVVLAMLSMLGIVALAIDVITLYSAKSEAQRAADAGALVAAKMLVDAGVTADPGNAALQTTAQTIATTAAKDVAKQSVHRGTSDYHLRRDGYVPQLGRREFWNQSASQRQRFRMPTCQHFSRASGAGRR